MYKVTITVEADHASGPTPTVMTWQHRMGGTSGNPRYAADAMQTAVIRGATDALTTLQKLVDLREGLTADHAAELLNAAIGVQS